MSIKRWLGVRSNKNATKATTSFSLSSPRGTSTARMKNMNHGLLSFLKRGGSLASLVVAAFLFVFIAATGIVIISLATYAVAPSRGLSPQQQQKSVKDSALKLVSRIKRSATAIRTFHRRRPRGHRYFDYWQDEEHNDYEPFPWESMKRSSSTTESLEPESWSVVHRNLMQKNQGRQPFMDDESYVSLPMTVNEDAKGNKGGIIFYDQSTFYVNLRQSYESFFPPPNTKTTESGRDHDTNAKRCLQAVEDLRTYSSIKTHLSPSDPNSMSDSDSDSTSPLFYHIHDCPDTPPQGYPVEWNLVHEVLSQWPADDPELPASGTIHQGICVFDLRTDYEANLAKAINYRNAEVPFVVKGDPSVAQTVERWNTPHYLSTLIGDEPQGTEISQSGRFTYWTGSGVDTHKYPMDGPDYKTPTEVTEMTFGEWIELANLTDSKLLIPESPHYYFKVVGCAPRKPPMRGDKRRGHRNLVDGSCSRLPGNAPHVSYLADELPFYAQTKSSLYIKEPLSESKRAGAASSGGASKALNCRFGMKGVMATNHFDGERNFVTVLSGERRYVLAHPRQCGNMALFPYGHPSARHSAVDWANPDLNEFPEFEKATGNEVVLQAGDSLFLPSLWFHYIVSMSMNVQCNTRSGMDQRNVKVLDDSCGW